MARLAKYYPRKLKKAHCPVECVICGKLIKKGMWIFYRTARNKTGEEEVWHSGCVAKERKEVSPEVSAELAELRELASYLKKKEPRQPDLVMVTTPSGGALQARLITAWNH